MSIICLCFAHVDDYFLFIMASIFSLSFNLIHYQKRGLGGQDGWRK